MDTLQQGQLCPSVQTTQTVLTVRAVPMLFDVRPDGDSILSRRAKTAAGQVLARKQKAVADAITSDRPTLGMSRCLAINLATDCWQQEPRQRCTVTGIHVQGWR